MKHASLFSGIGGFDLAAEWMGWENTFHCEWNPFGQKVLKHYWPEAESFNDITKTDFTKYANQISILTGGFPCQPYSSAGKRKGKDDERHLWPEMLRAIREIRPRWVVGENVFGLVNWSAGLVFHEVQADLEAEGYEVFPFLLPAAAVNAPHRRDRIWFVAYAESARNRQQQGKNCQQSHRQPANNGKNGNAANPNSDGQHRSNSKNEINASKTGKYAQCNIKPCNDNGNVADTECSRLGNGNKTGNIRSKEKTPCSKRGKSSNDFKTNGKKYVTNADGFGLRRESNRIGNSGFTCKNEQANNWQNFPLESPVCGGNDGLPTELDGITFSKWRNESIKGYGNAIVPQVAYQIFKAIRDYELQNL